MKKILFFTFFVISFPQLVLPSFAVPQDANEDDRTSSYISIKGLEPIEVIEALWNNAIIIPKYRQNEGSLATASTENFPQEEVRKKLNEGTWFDYFLGVTYFGDLSSRPLNIFLCGDSFHSHVYNQSHGYGRAERVISRLRETGRVDSMEYLPPEQMTDLIHQSMLGDSAQLDIYLQLRSKFNETRRKN